jgi:hypothetical protein
MFCGECGRAVGTRTATVVHPDSGMPVAGSDASSVGEFAPVVTDARDTAIIEPIVRDRLPELETELPPAAPDLPDEPEIAEPEAEPAEAELAEAELAEPEPAVIEQDLPPDVVAEEAAQESAFAVVPAPSAPAPTLPVRPDPFPWGDRGSAIFSDSDELEQTLIVPRRETGERFVLQFSTGESVTVFGSGLLGRNPTPQPTEYFDQLVSITDPGKSVSKTHLEFGQEAGSFWVSDRFSGNGSAVREPEAAPRRLVAGKRYRIVRGTRVDIGEQFFVVS